MPYEEINHIDHAGTGRDPSLHDQIHPPSPTIHELSNRLNGRQKKMVLNEFGQIALAQWKWLGNQYPYVILHAFVVMPNHIHGILEVDSTRVEKLPGISRQNPDLVGTGAEIPVPIIMVQEIRKKMKIKPLPELVGAHKTSVSKQIHLLGFKEFQWQRSFYDRIIRSHASYVAITRYIESNPQRWELDEFNI